MNIQLIVLPQSILISDEKIREGDRCLANAKTYSNEIVQYRRSPCPLPLTTHVMNNNQKSLTTQLKFLKYYDTTRNTRRKQTVC